MTFMDLPTEIALAILEYAARAHVTGDRPWVVQLALVSTAVYETVRPSLYRILVITDQNRKQFESAKAPDRILPFVRSLSVFVDREESLTALQPYLSRWSPPADAQAYFDAPSSLAMYLLNRLQDLHPAPCCCIASILTRYGLLHRNVLPAFYSSMPTPITANLKQIGGYLPISGQWQTSPGSLTSWPRDWGQAVLDSLPALWQILFRFVDVGVLDEYLENMEEYLLEVLEMVRGMIEHRPDLKVTIVIGGDYLQQEAEAKTLLEDPKLTGHLDVWFDRRMTTWTGVNQADAEDAWSGRDIWSSPPPEALERPSVPPALI